MPMLNTFRKIVENPRYALHKLRENPGRVIHRSHHLSKSGEVGCQEATADGWYSYSTGELCRGFPITGDDTLIDVGCGDGNNTVFAATQGAKVIATDIDAEKVETVEKKLKSLKAREYRAICSDSNPLPVEDASVSRVVSMEVMEHVEEPPKFLAELARVARPGALLLITVPDPASETIQKYAAPDTYWQKPNHLHVFGRETFASLVRDAGLEIEHRSYRCFFWAMWWALFWAADQEFGEPDKPLLESWAHTWSLLLASPHGEPVRQALNEFMPKDQVIIARKAA